MTLPADLLPLSLLQKGARKLGVALSDSQLHQFTRYREELLAWNQRVNLTAITVPAEVETLHFLDSLTLALALPAPAPPGYRLCDIGAGAGFPGVPLKIAFPQIRLTLVEATGKKTAFLRRLMETLALEAVDIFTGRAEELAHRPDLREALDFVTARAVAELPALLELTLPFCRVGGRTVLMKKGDLSKELAASNHALAELGGRLQKVMPVPEDVLPGQRALVVVQKVRATPANYPRRPGLPAKRPL